MFPGIVNGAGGPTTPWGTGVPITQRRVPIIRCPDQMIVPWACIRSRLTAGGTTRVPPLAARSEWCLGAAASTGR